MVKFASLFLVALLLISVIFCSDSSKSSRKRTVEEFNSEGQSCSSNFDSFKRKHFENDISSNEIISLIENLTLSDKTETMENPFLRALDAKIPLMSDKTIHSVVTSNFFYQNLEVLKLFHRHGRLRGMIDFSDITFLFWLNSANSREIARFIFENGLHAGQNISQHTLKNLFKASATSNIECFRILTRDFGFERASDLDIADILIFALNNDNFEVVSIIRDLNSKRFDEICKLAITMSVRNTDNYKALRFFSVEGFSFDHLSTRDVRNGLISAAKHCDTPLTSRFIDPCRVDGEELFDRFREAPWILAAERDCPDLVLFYIDLIPDIDLYDIFTAAASSKSLKVIDGIMTLGRICQPDLLIIFKTAVDNRDLPAIESLLDTNMTINEVVIPGTELNPLSYAICRNFFGAVALLLGCGAKVNEVIVLKPRFGLNQYVNCLYFVKKVEILDLLRPTKDDVNFIFETLNDDRILFSRTTLLHISASEGNSNLYNRLLALEADETILDSEGKSAKEIFSEIDDLYC